MKKLDVNEAGELIDTARVEITNIGPVWSPLIRYRFYMTQQPENHLTHWYVHKLSKYLGSYTPPGWFLRLIGQVKE